MQCAPCVCLSFFPSYLFIKLLPSYEDVVPKPRRIVLPKKSRSAPRVSLVLDLDETLVHCSIEPIPDADLTFKVAFNGQDYEVFVRKRPFLGHFLEQVSKMFEVTVFTASQSVYAQKLLDLIDPRGRLVECVLWVWTWTRDVDVGVSVPSCAEPCLTHLLAYALLWWGCFGLVVLWIVPHRHRLFREACLNVDGNYLKDLTVLGRDLRHTVLVDNSPHAFGYQVDNGIPIESWFEDPADTEVGDAQSPLVVFVFLFFFVFFFFFPISPWFLVMVRLVLLVTRLRLQLLKLLQFLKTIQHSKDVRPHVRRKFRMWDLINAA